MKKLKVNITPVQKKISRREAIEKLGYSAFAAGTLLLLLNNPTQVHAQSPGDPGDPGGGWGAGMEGDLTYEEMMLLEELSQQ